MSVRTLLLLAGLLVFAVGCEEKKVEPFKMPEIPAGLESKPGFGGMGGGEAPAEDEAAVDAADAADAATEGADAVDAESNTPATTPPAE